MNFTGLEIVLAFPNEKRVCRVADVESLLDITLQYFRLPRLDTFDGRDNIEDNLLDL